MLSDNAIDNLIQIIVDRQEEINIYVLTKIVEKLRLIGALSLQDINRMKILISMGADIRLMNEYIARETELQVQSIKNLIRTVAVDNYLDAKPLYDYRYKSFIPFERNMELQQVTNAVADQTANTYENLSNSRATGFLVKDLKHPGKLVFKPLDHAYRDAVDKAIQAVQSGVVNKETAIRDVVKQLTKSGLRRMYWDSGYTQRLDTAVRRNIQDGVKQINQRIQDAIGKQIGADGKELSAHQNSAPDHEPCQGHQFTNAEYDKLQNNESFKDIDGTSFAGVDRIIGEWNCRHFAYSIIVGVSKPRYSKEKLQKFIDNNHAGYIDQNGNHYSLYECTQIQRRIETKIRYAKEDQMLMKELGDKTAKNLARSKVQRLTNEYRAFSKSCGLPIKVNRTSVPNYKSW